MTKEFLRIAFMVFLFLYGLTGLNLVFGLIVEKRVLTGLAHAGDGELFARNFIFEVGGSFATGDAAVTSDGENAGASEGVHGDVFEVIDDGGGFHMWVTLSAFYISVENYFRDDSILSSGISERIWFQ